MATKLQLGIKDIAPLREKFRKRQKSICPLCKKPITKAQAALDHDHETGHCRTTLHRNCNSIEGRVLSWARRSGIDPREFLKNLLDYWEQDYSHNPVHPRHKNEKQKEITRLRKRLRSAKRESTKQKIRDLIKELQK